jgi:photosystem II stability/assembly factor-like uncharacterized protein
MQVPCRTLLVYHIFFVGRYLDTMLIYRSTDDGVNWTQLNNDLHAFSDIRRMATDSSRTVYLGGSMGLYYSNDNGDTWKINTLIEIFDMGVSTNGNLWMGTYNGIYISTDHGSHWKSRNTGIQIQPNTSVWSIACTPDSVIFAGNGGVCRSGDRGESWERISREGAILTIGIRRSGNVYAAPDGPGVQGSLLKSTDRGNSWNRIDIAGQRGSIFSLCFAPETTIFAETISGEIFRSLDDGQKWEELNSNLDSMACVSSLLYYRNGIVFASTWGNGLSKSTDNGDTWVRMNMELPYDQTASAITDRRNWIFVCTPSGVFRSTDEGQSWERTFLADTTVTVLAINNVGDIYAQGKNNIYKSVDGSCWIDLGGGQSKPILALAFDSSGYAYAGTYGEGVLRSKQSTTDIKDIPLFVPASYFLYQNYPNPFNPNTMIRYELPKESFVTLKVYDVLGREVAMLVNGVEEPGKKSVVFDANRFSSGVYFYRLKAGEYLQTKKLLLTK